MNVTTALTVGLIALCLSSLASAAGVTEARVATSHGVPRLLLDGKPTVPFIFFYNTDCGGPDREQLLRGQMQVVMGAGCHIYSLPLRVPRLPGTNAPNFAYADGLLDRFIAIDPDALFLVRVYPGPDRGWPMWRDLPATDIVTFADGNQGGPALASAIYQREFAADLRAMIRHFEGSPYGRRIIAYHPGGPEHEMFGDSYRDKGSDCSVANTLGFRRWLTGRYHTDAALQRAWGKPAVTLGTAAVPVGEPGRFPMHGDAAPVPFFYELPAQQDWADYSAYCSDLTADCLIRWARLIKEETGGRRLSAFFYGYTIELPGSFSGHYQLQRVLACPDVDILAGPWSYDNRRGGDPASFMSLVDTIAAHGKLWFNEDDSRTSLLEQKYLNPAGKAFNDPITAADLDETVAVLDRNLRATIAHRAGTWWMDLMSAGAFNHPRLTELLQQRWGEWEESVKHPTPARPDVAVIVDEHSKDYVRSDWTANYWTMVRLRTALGKCGHTVGWYSLADYVAGVVPPCRSVVLANAFYLDAAQRQGLRARLRRKQPRAIWIYAPGCLGPGGLDPAGATELVGLRLDVKPGQQGSVGAGLLSGLNWGEDIAVHPRLAVMGTPDETLGTYRADGLTSAARSHAAGYDSVLLADALLSAEVFQRLIERR